LQNRESPIPYRRLSRIMARILWSNRTYDLKGLTAQAKATREAPAQAEHRPTCAGASGLASPKHITPTNSRSGYLLISRYPNKGLNFRVAILWSNRTHDLRGTDELPKTNERPPGRSFLNLPIPVSFSAQKSYLSTLSFVKTVGGPSRIWLPLMILSLPSLPASNSVSPGFSFPSITARIA
jgi:hypothetical protein